MPRLRMRNEELQVIYQEMKDIISGNNSTDSDLATIANAIMALAFHIDRIERRAE